VSSRAMWGEVTPECNMYTCAQPVLMSRLCPDPKCKAIPCEDNDSCARVKSLADQKSNLTLNEDYTKYAPWHTLVISSIPSSRMT
jgi:hypothetical protein